MKVELMIKHEHLFLMLLLCTLKYMKSMNFFILMIYLRNFILFQILYFDKTNYSHAYFIHCIQKFSSNPHKIDGQIKYKLHIFTFFTNYSELLATFYEVFKNFFVCQQISLISLPIHLTFYN